MYWNYEVLDAGTKDPETRSVAIEDALDPIHRVLHLDVCELSSLYNYHLSAPFHQSKICSTGFRPIHKLPAGTA